MAVSQSVSVCVCVCVSVSQPLRTYRRAGIILRTGLSASNHLSALKTTDIKPSLGHKDKDKESYV